MISIGDVNSGIVNIPCVCNEGNAKYWFNANENKEVLFLYPCS